MSPSCIPAGIFAGLIFHGSYICSQASMNLGMDILFENRKYRFGVRLSCAPDKKHIYYWMALHLGTQTAQRNYVDLKQEFMNL